MKEGKLTAYKGNYSDYTKQKEIELQQKQLAYEKYEKEKKQLEEAIKLKEEKAQRATKKPKNISDSEARVKGAKPYFAKKQKKLQKTATAMETRIENLEQVDKVKELPPIKMSLPNAETFKNRIILRVEDVSGMIGNRVLFNNINFHIHGGDKLAVIGPNGSGKNNPHQKARQRRSGYHHFPISKNRLF